MKWALALIELALAALAAHADTYRLNPDGTVSPVAVAVAVAPAPRAKEAPQAKPCPCKSCDCAGGKCDCGPACSCPSCPAVPPGYAAIYARVMKGERVVFEVHEKIGDWDKGVWDCYLENGVPKCELRQIRVVTVVTHRDLSAPGSSYRRQYPAGRFDPPCIGGT